MRTQLVTNTSIAFNKTPLQNGYTGVVLNATAGAITFEGSDDGTFTDTPAPVAVPAGSSVNVTFRKFHRTTTAATLNFLADA